MDLLQRGDEIRFYILSFFSVFIKCIIVNFQILHGIRTQYENGIRITDRHVNEWKSLIISVREQVKIFEEISSIPELNDLFFFFVSSLCISYMAFSLVLENVEESGAMIPYAVGGLVFSMARTYMKGSLAEVLKEEVCIFMRNLYVRITEL